MAGYTYVINVGGYVGLYTRSEIKYAQQHVKRVEYLKNEN